ncbi:SHOCT domain-containing protein [Mycolicibacterium bacteremicum]|uniref:SHOCT domain-containing protein n=1 Tax=Mycolicibacterium bacteremicum TaxID=564198 RepID=UPI0026F19701|nr:SHOCT domain-containing protein [Mycolicibacterium bacteremicum]
MRTATAPRLLTIVAVLTMVVAGIGFIAVLVLNAFVLDRYNAYGEVAIPGRAELQLPAGEVTISFHTQIIGSTGGGGLPIPDLRMAIDPPPGVAEPEVVESIGGTTTVNNDARVRVWVAQVAESGVYTVRTDGNVTAFISPRLAFGHASPMGQAPWWCAAVFGLGLVDLIIARVWAARVRRAARPVSPTFTVTGGPTSYIPTEDGIRIEQLKTLAALRDSGALTEAEFEAEKRRLLGGG